MVLPVLKLGLLAFWTMSKPIASRLKQQAGNDPKFRELIINLAQVLKHNEEVLTKELEELKEKLRELAWP